MAAAKKRRKCGGCGGLCGGRRGSCKFAANEAKRRADDLWAYAKAVVAGKGSDTKPLTRCAAGRDGECGHAKCPQLRDNEPRSTGRHCPLDSEGGRHD